jgi:hypothetical protein
MAADIDQPGGMSKGSSLLIKITERQSRENTQLRCAARTNTISLTPLT